GRDPITIVAAVQGEPTTAEAITVATQLAETAKSLYVEKTVVRRGDVLATMTSAWGESSDIIATEDMATFGWKYSKVNNPRIVINTNPPFVTNATVGSVIVHHQSTDIVAAEAI